MPPPAQPQEDPESPDTESAKALLQIRSATKNDSSTLSCQASIQETSGLARRSSSEEPQTTRSLNRILPAALGHHGSSLATLGGLAMTPTSSTVPSDSNAIAAARFSGIPTAQLQPAPVSNSSTMFSVLDLLRGQANLAQHAIAHSSTPSTTAVHAADARQRADSFIRKDQVEAALKSKPQRGRKRQELNEHERVELTRTRNREHARSTRMRKKARYEQLIEEERCLHQFQEKAVLQSQRRAAVMRYIKLREQMLLSMNKSPAYNSNSIPPDNTKLSALFRDCVEDMDQLFLDFGVTDTKNSSSAVNGMIAFDTDLAARIRQLFGADSLSTVHYSVINGSDGVSLDCCDGGVVEIDLTISGNERQRILQGYLRFKFASPTSTKLSTLCWRQTQNNMEFHAAHLHAQVSHPSVVSLDPVAHAEPTASEVTKQSSSMETTIDGQNGPGMNICG